MYTYICTCGHVDEQPSMGSIDTCQVMVPVAANGTVRGSSPCGLPVVKVPHDSSVEATYRVGGPDAVLTLLMDRIAGVQSIDVGLYSENMALAAQLRGTK
jgi:hypothetical protein